MAQAAPSHSGFDADFHPTRQMVYIDDEGVLSGALQFYEAEV